MVKRRSRQNYLSHNEPFDLDVLLDEAYWLSKSSRLTHSHNEIIRLSALNKLDVYHHFSGVPIHEFLDFKEGVESEDFKVKHLFWSNQIDSTVPYESGFNDQFWNVSIKVQAAVSGL